MSTAAIIVLAVLAVIVLLIVTGYVARSRRDSSHSVEFRQHLANVDSSLEAARASDKGWERGVLEATAREGLAERRPDFEYDDLHLVLVDDRPGVTEDRAHLLAVGGTGEARVILVRDERGWTVEGIE